MAKRATELIGKPVISAEGGEKLGTVADLLLDDVNHGLVGVVVSHGLLKSEEVLPADAVQSFGRDAVVSRSGELIARQDWRDSQGLSTRTSEPHEPPRR